MPRFLRCLYLLNSRLVPKNFLMEKLFQMLRFSVVLLTYQLTTLIFQFTETLFLKLQTSLKDCSWERSEIKLPITSTKLSEILFHQLLTALSLIKREKPKSTTTWISTGLSILNQLSTLKPLVSELKVFSSQKTKVKLLHQLLSLPCHSKTPAQNLNSKLSPVPIYLTP